MLHQGKLCSKVLSRFALRLEGKSLRRICQEQMYLAMRCFMFIYYRYRSVFARNRTSTSIFLSLVKYSHQKFRTVSKFRRKSDNINKLNKKYLRLKDFTGTEFDTSFSSNKPHQLAIKAHSFGVQFCLHHQVKGVKTTNQNAN